MRMQYSILDWIMEQQQQKKNFRGKTNKMQMKSVV